MPHAIEMRLCWLIQQEGEEDEEVEFFTTIAQDIVNTLSWFAWYDWRIMLVGMHKAGCGMWLSFVDLPTLQLLPDVTDAMAISEPWLRVKTGPNQFVVSGGQAIMNLAAQGWRKALRNEAGTNPTLHSLASLYAQALEPKNSNVKLMLNWTNFASFARHWAETELKGRMVMLVEKAINDMGVAAEDNAGAIVSLKYDDDTVPIFEVELKIVNSNEVKLLGPKNAQEYVSYGPRVWCANSPVVKACDQKQYPWLILDAQPASNRSIYYDAMAIGSKTLKSLVKTRKLFSGGKKIPVVHPHPKWREGERNREWNSAKQDYDTFDRFDSTEPILKCAKTKKVFKLDTEGRYQLAPGTDTPMLYVRDLKAVCLNPAVKGAAFIPGGDAKAVIKAVQDIAKVEKLEPTTLREANLRCSLVNMDAWVKSLFLAQALLGDILVCGDRFTDYKDHMAFDVDGQIVEATVATLQLREDARRGNPRLCFVFNSELQRETQEQDAERQDLAYYASACLIACRSFTEAELKCLDITLSSARLAQLGGYPIDVAYLLPTDPGSYDDGMGDLRTGVYPNLADFRAMLKNGRFKRKERSAIDELLKDSFCFKREVPERAKALGRTYVGWRNAMGNSMPGVPTVPEPPDWVVQHHGPPNVVSEPDHPTSDHGWGSAKMREKVQI
jgi:hypothetical protein